MDWLLIVALCLLLGGIITALLLLQRSIARLEERDKSTNDLLKHMIDLEERQSRELASIDASMHLMCNTITKLHNRLDAIQLAPSVIAMPISAPRPPVASPGGTQEVEFRSWMDVKRAREQREKEKQ